MEKLYGCFVMCRYENIYVPIAVFRINYYVITMGVVGMGMNKEEFEKIIRDIERNQTERLVLDNKSLSEEQVVKLATAVGSNTSLQRFTLNNNQLSDVSGKAIAGILQTNTSLKMLTLCNNRLGDNIGVDLARALIGNCVLTHLELGGNQLGNDTGLAFADVLDRNNTLEHLGLNHNRLDDVSGLVLANAVKQNITLKGLYLYNNQFTDITGVALAKAMRFNNTVSCLSLEHNQMGDISAKEFMEALRINTSIHTIGLSHNQIDGNILENLENIVVEEARSKVMAARETANKKLNEISRRTDISVSKQSSITTVMREILDKLKVQEEQNKMLARQLKAQEEGKQELEKMRLELLRQITATLFQLEIQKKQLETTRVTQTPSLLFSALPSLAGGVEGVIIPSSSSSTITLPSSSATVPIAQSGTAFLSSAVSPASFAGVTGTPVCRVSPMPFTSR